VARPTPARPLAATIEIVKDVGNSHMIGASEPAADVVEFGLWDNAYDSAGAVITDSDITKDFISTDSRRFFFRVRHAAAAGRKFVKIKWRTLYASGSPQDSPTDSTLTLKEVARGVFVSSAVMLVTENVDAMQPTTSQLIDVKVRPRSEPRNRGQSDHRLRLGSMFGSVQAIYPAASANQVIQSVPIFLGRRRIVSVQVFVIQNAFSVTEFPDAMTRIGSSLLRRVTGCYERLGIWFFAAGTPGRRRRR